MTWILLALLTTIAACLMGYLHYLVKRILGHDIGPPTTYVVGVGLGILVPFFTWLLCLWFIDGLYMPLWWPAVGITAITAGAGFGTMLAYHYDNADLNRNKANRGQRLVSDELQK